MTTSGLHQLIGLLFFSLFLAFCLIRVLEQTDLISFLTAR